MTRVRPLPLLLALGAAVVALGAGVAAAGAASTPPVAFPSSQTIPATGALPAGGTAAINLEAARGDHESAWIVVRGGGTVSASVDAAALGGATVELAWGHFVPVEGKPVPDALLPWDGSGRGAEQPNQPLFVRVTVPDSAVPGSYVGAVKVTGAGGEQQVPLFLRIHPFTIPAANRADGNLLTSFHVSPQSYVKAAAGVYGYTSNDQRRAANDAFFAFLSSYRLSPSSWGYGEPRSGTGYEPSKKWWLDAAGNMQNQMTAGFSTMRIPISNNRTAPQNWIGKLDPKQPQTWCDYLKSTRGFWEHRGWLKGSVQFVYGQDEPDLAGMKLVQQQALAAHTCWPGSKVLMTGNPSPTGDNAFLSDGKGGDDVDIWTVLSRRYYGTWGKDRTRSLYAAIGKVRQRASVWSYTYGANVGTPGFAATEPLSNPRMLLLWNGLEGIRGLLYGQGTTSYRPGNPLNGLDRKGEFVLMYPGPERPIPSARLEQIRDGIEDWAVLEAVRRQAGDAKVRAILGGAKLFSADAKGVKLACNIGCELKSSTKFSWPLWSSDASTPRQIEAAHAAALAVAR
jgi:hypothetical protein